MVFADSAFPTTLDPDLNYIKSETQGPPMEAIYGLLGYADPETGNTTFEFLQSATPSSNYTVWTLVLHKGLQFSDGTPFNAAAVAFNIQRGANPNSGDTYRLDLAQMKPTVVNATTLKITLPAPNTQFVAQLMQEMPFIASPTAVRAEGAGFATHPVGAGPFKLVQWTQNSTMTMVPNKYFAKFAPGEPYLKNLTFQDLPTGVSQELSALSAGTAQMAWLQGNQQISQARSGGSTVQVNVAGGGEWLVFNMSRPPFSNPIARQAVSLALNHQDLATAWTPGIPAMTNWFPKTSVFYDKAYDFPGQDTTEARKLFSELKSEGHPVSFTITVPSFYSSAADYVQSALSQYPGVSVKLNLVLTSAYLTDQVSGNFDMTMGGTAYANPIPSLIAYLAPNGSANFGHWNDPAVANAIAKILATTSVADQKAQWASIQREVLAQNPFFTAQESELGLAYSPSLGGVHGVEFGTIPLFEQIYKK